MNLVRVGTRTGLLLICAASLAGCAGALLRTKLDPPVVYQLKTGRGAPHRPIAADLRVLTPLVRAGLDTDRIAASYPDGRLDYFADARWSGRLAVVIGQLAVREFRARSGLRNVVGAASALRPPLWLELEVTEFQADYPAAGGPPVIHVQLIARLGDARHGTTLGSYAAGASQVALANRMTAIVAAFDAAADAALDPIVTAVDQRLSAGPD